jgi:hypothetical protein
MKRIIVCGCRDWDDMNSVVFELSLTMAGIFFEHEIAQVCIVDGGATGADCMAKNAAYQLGCRSETHPADWKAHGKAAGPRRNDKMAKLGADICIAFWDGKSRGTLNMIQTAVTYGIPVRIVPKKVPSA